MTEFIVHYVSGGDPASPSLAADHATRHAKAERLPIVGEMLTSSLGVVELILDVAFSRDGTGHVFVTPTMPPAHIAQGLKTADYGSPSIAAFEGETVADLLIFISRFPSNYPVRISDRQVLVARSKSNEILLLLDDPEDV